MSYFTSIPCYNLSRRPRLGGDPSPRSPSRASPSDFDWGQPRMRKVQTGEPPSQEMTLSTRTIRQSKIRSGWRSQ